MDMIGLWSAYCRMDSQIPYFCGDTEECRTLGSRQALETAKANIESTFVVVGVLEELDMTHKVRTCIYMPQCGQGLDTYLHRCWSVSCLASSQGWPRSMPSMTSMCTATTRTQRSSGDTNIIHSDMNGMIWFLPSFSDEAKRILKEKLALEYELYDFVNARLNNQYNECQEKIRP